jgi:hypothetical protein
MKRSAYRILVGKFEEVGWSGMKLTDLVKNRGQGLDLANTIMNLRIP